MKHRFLFGFLAMAMGLLFNYSCSEEDLLELESVDPLEQELNDDATTSAGDDTPPDPWKENESLIDPDYPYYLIFDMEVDGEVTKVVANGTKKRDTDYEFEASSLYCGSTRTHYEYQTTCKPENMFIGSEQIHTFFLAFRGRCPACELEDNLYLGSMPFCNFDTDLIGASFGISTYNLRKYSSIGVENNGDEESFIEILSIEDHPTFATYKIVEARFQSTLYFGEGNSITVRHGIMRGLISSNRHMIYDGEE